MAETQNKDKSPKISIIVPVYNVEKYLRRCIDSILAQTFTDFELILVDDGSPDRCPVICDEYAEKDSRVHVIHQENKGSAGARRVGTEIASGKFLYFCDSDDWCDPYLLENFVNVQRQTDADIVGCDLVREYEHRKEIFPIPLKETSDENLRYLLLGEIPGWLHVKFIRASLFQNHDCYWRDGINMCEDLLMSTRLFFYAKKFSYVPKVLYHYNCSNLDALSLSLSENKIKEIKLAYKELYNFLVQKGKRDSLQDELLVCQFRLANWILLSSTEIDKSYFDIFSKQKFYKNKYFSKFQKIYLFLCYYKLYFFPFLFIKLKRRKNRNKQ